MRRNVECTGPGSVCVFYVCVCCMCVCVCTPVWWHWWEPAARQAVKDTEKKRDKWIVVAPAQINELPAFLGKRVMWGRRKEQRSLPRGDPRMGRGGGRGCPPAHLTTEEEWRMKWAQIGLIGEGEDGDGKGRLSLTPTGKEMACWCICLLDDYSLSTAPTLPCFLGHPGTLRFAS